MIQLRTRINAAALTGILVVASAFPALLAQVASPDAPSPSDQTAPDKTDAIERPVVLKIVAASVRDAQGLPLGRLENIILNPSSGRIDFAIVSNLILTNNPKLIAIPWARLSPRSDPLTLDSTPGFNQIFVVNADRNRLLRAPSFERSRWPNLSRADWATPYLNYFGASPETSPSTVREAGTETEARTPVKKTLTGTPLTNSPFLGPNLPPRLRK